MNLAAWAERDGVVRVTSYRSFRSGVLPVPARTVGRLILVEDPAGHTGMPGRSAVYAWVCSADQKADLDRQVARVAAWATAQKVPGRWDRDRGWVRVERAPSQVPCAAA
jgi:predicted site-specific integrase-resolvase